MYKSKDEQVCTDCKKTLPITLFKYHKNGCVKGRCKQCQSIIINNTKSQRKVWADRIYKQLHLNPSDY